MTERTSGLSNINPPWPARLSAESYGGPHEANIKRVERVTTLILSRFYVSLYVRDGTFKIYTY